MCRHVFTHCSACDPVPPDSLAESGANTRKESALKGGAATYRRKLRRHNNAQPAPSEQVGLVVPSPPRSYGQAHNAQGTAIFKKCWGWAQMAVAVADLWCASVPAQTVLTVGIHFDMAWCPQLATCSLF